GRNSAARYPSASASCLRKSPASISPSIIRAHMTGSENSRNHQCSERRDMHEQPADGERDVVVIIWPTAKNVSTAIDADGSGDRRDQHNGTDPAKPIQEKSGRKRSGWPEQAPDFYVSEFEK